MEIYTEIADNPLLLLPLSSLVAFIIAVVYVLYNGWRKDLGITNYGELYEFVDNKRPVGEAPSAGKATSQEPTEDQPDSDHASVTAPTYLIDEPSGSYSSGTDTLIRKKKVSRATRFSSSSHIDYKDADFLLNFITEDGKLLPRSITGTSLKFHRKLSQAIKRARHLALIPYQTNELK